MQRARRAFTLVELLVVIGIITLLISILLPVLGKAQDAARKTSCSSNLRQIGQAIKMYNGDFGEFPRTGYNYNSATIAAFSGARDSNPFSSGSKSTTNLGAAGERPADNDVTAALFLLIRCKFATAGIFVCASADSGVDDFEGGSAETRSNFTDRRNLSYSVTLPYQGAKVDAGNSGVDMRGVGILWGDRMRSDMALAADMNPGATGTPPVFQLTLSSSASDMIGGNSRNHKQTGQNVLFFDGSARWCQTPFVGSGSDNIYTRCSVRSPVPQDQASDTSYPFNMPAQHAQDNLLLPVEGSTGISAY